MEEGNCPGRRKSILKMLGRERERNITLGLEAVLHCWERGSGRIPARDGSREINWSLLRKDFVCH